MSTMSGLDRPNVILLTADQHRAMSFGAYGSEEVLTPCLDGLARESLQFERAYCQYPQCVASRQSLLTGQYPSSHGAFGVNMQSIDPGQWTVAGAFRDAGYKTALIGFPHCNESGFEDNRNSARWYRNRPDSERKATIDEHFGLDYLENARTAGPLHIPEEYLMDDYTWREAVKFLHEKHERPFFLWVSLRYPHPPFRPPRRFWDLYDPAGLRLAPADPNRERHPFWSREIFTAEMQRNYLHGYYASISYADWCLGNVLQAVRETGRMGDSIIAYTSDHGENGGYHGAYEKHSFYEPSVHVPLLLRTPDTRPGRVPEIVEIMDLAPTFTSYCRVPVGTHPYDGVSLEPLWNGMNGTWKNRAISEYYQKIPRDDGETDTGRSFGRMLVEDGFKCCLNGNMVDENSLFDLANDPGEVANLWHDPRHSKRRDHMRAVLLEKWRREWYPYQGKTPRS